MSHKSSTARGFTIVELLIVIVVIGILAAITIVAYNGVQNKARSAQVQSDANGIGKLLAIANVNTGSFPNDLSTVNNGQPMSVADGTSYNYHPGSGNNSYCVTVTNATTSYRVTDTATSPVAGGCPGDGVGGVAAVTNLATNPSFEATSGVSIYGSATVANPTVPDAYSGSHVLRFTKNGSSGSIYGPWWNATTSATPGQPYYAQLAIRSNNIQSRNLRIEWIALDGGSIVSSVTLQTFSTTPGWQIVGGTAVAPAGVGWIRLTLYGVGNTGDYIDVDAVIITQGIAAFNFASGDSPNWIWNGTPNTSTSTGPPQ